MQPWSQPLLWPHPSGAVACDPYFGNVVLLTGFEGAMGTIGTPGAGWTDLSPSAHGLPQLGGSVSIDTTNFKFGTGAGHWPSTSSERWAPSADWALGSGQFTIETWLRLNSTGASRVIIGMVQAGLYSWFLWFDGSGNLAWTISTDGSSFVNDITYIWSPSLATWYHVAVDYNGSKYRMYVNGTMVGSSTTLRTIYNSSDYLALGCNTIGSGLFLDGWLDEVRITKGFARYASDAGFAVPTAAFPRVQC